MPTAQMSFAATTAIPYSAVAGRGLATERQVSPQLGIGVGDRVGVAVLNGGSVGAGVGVRVGVRVGVAVRGRAGPWL